MKDECLLCGAALEYLKEDIPMRCELCGREELSATRCEKGHYVCGECHSKGVDSIIDVCLKENSADPTAILEKLMDMPFCHMHGPEHHIIVGSALLTAYKNAGGDIDLKSALLEMQKRGRSVPGGACGFWGACGAAISAGMFVSIATGSTPLANREWGLSNLMTSAVLERIGKIGGPRCCKRNGKLAVLTAVDFAAEQLGVKMDNEFTPCKYTEQNNQCIGTRCPFFKAEKNVKIRVKIKE